MRCVGLGRFFPQLPSRPSRLAKIIDTISFCQNRNQNQGQGQPRTTAWQWGGALPDPQPSIRLDRLWLWTGRNRIGGNWRAGKEGGTRCFCHVTLLSEAEPEQTQTDRAKSAIHLVHTELQPELPECRPIRQQRALVVHTPVLAGARRKPKKNTTCQWRQRVWTLSQLSGPPSGSCAGVGRLERNLPEDHTAGYGNLVMGIPSRAVGSSNSDGPKRPRGADQIANRQTDQTLGPSRIACRQT